MTPTVSILICTRNHAASLRQTLDAIARCDIPAVLSVELLVIDNGSPDDTPAVVADAPRGNLSSLRLVHEPQPGQTRARNRGLAESIGAAILFTDDDTRPPKNWITSMSGPILADETDAIAGGVVLPNHLLRTWMTPAHRAWLASTELLPTEPNWRMIGANMAFSRRVLEKVPAFDVELGPGALGFGDDTLFSQQIVRAGFRVQRQLDIAVEHHFDTDRLTPTTFHKMAEKLGRSEAYVEHHWIHYDRGLPRLRCLKHWLHLKATALFGTGLAMPELELIRQTALYAQALEERRRPRHYAHLGLRRLDTP